MSKTGDTALDYIDELHERRFKEQAELEQYILRAIETGQRQWIGEWGPTGHRIYLSVEKKDD